MVRKQPVINWSILVLLNNETLRKLNVEWSLTGLIISYNYFLVLGMKEKNYLTTHYLICFLWDIQDTQIWLNGLLFAFQGCNVCYYGCTFLHPIVHLLSTSDQVHVYAFLSVYPWSPLNACPSMCTSSTSKLFLIVNSHSSNKIFNVINVLLVWFIPKYNHATPWPITLRDPIIC